MQQSIIVFNPVFNKASKESKKPDYVTVIDYENKKIKLVI